MTQALKISFEDYLSLDAGNLPDQRYEYINGELKKLPPESRATVAIANYLFLLLVNAGIPFNLIYPHTCEVEVPVLQAGDSRTRIPDLVILRPEHLALTQKRLTITRDMPPPILIAEVVSPGDANRKRDYERKRQQYQELGVLEYWLIDSKQQTITILQLAAEQYVEVGVFRSPDCIISVQFPHLHLSAEQILSGGA
ncbi:MAG: Uma2 family endonuclease [Pegethrix bostrychoides GSE-TBD4-15B]|jgi:Uma2 family endonuclease|uniref:Uma2 family endonuclease n=1 Tax=Pegethrix bostrychoides GSE-TBD4-15B TaxID=2839662 RepID=A0A951U6N8_9CYAN|nr:Uma2 family endonuclease [Pegethrix bostrychoides GSE-TBD4-15B]